jgi:hypothetical protein
MPLEIADPLVKRGMRVEYSGSPPTVAFVQVSDGFGASYAGIDLFGMAADDVIAEIARRENRDPRVYAPGRHQYYFPDLHMGLWRSVVSEDDGDQGYLFDCVSVHAPGYFDAKTMAYVRRQSGLPEDGS